MRSNMAKSRAAEQDGQEGHGKITKTEAVRLALDAGKDKPIDGVNWIKAEHGIDITPQQFSTVKSNLKAKGGNGTGARKPSKPLGGGPVGNGFVGAAEAAAAVKELCNQIGAEQVKKLAGLFE